MIKRAETWTLLALLVLSSACAPNGEVAREQGAPEEAATVPSEAVAGLPAVAVLIAHRVADYDAWKTVFDDHMEARKEASCLGHYLKRGVDDPDVVYVYCLATDGDALRAFLDSADLAATMESAGVQGEPAIITIKPMSRNLVPEQRLPGIIVLHAVEDYDAWRVVYDELDAFRRESGIVGHAVGRQTEDLNHLVVYHQANDIAPLRAFVESAEFAEAMQRGGVMGDPDIRFIQVVEFADY